jgi:LPXTG-motif cell wall-anchored protein
MKLRQATSGAALTVGAVLLSFSLPQLAFAADTDTTADASARAAAVDAAALVDGDCDLLVNPLDPDCFPILDPDPEPTIPVPTIPVPTIPTPDPEPTVPEPTIPTPDPEPTTPQPTTPTPTIPTPGGGNVSDGGAVAPGLGNSVPQGLSGLDSSLGGLVASGSGAAATPRGEELPATGVEGGLNLLAALGAVFLLIGGVLLRRPYSARHRLV